MQAATMDISFSSRASGAFEGIEVLGDIDIATAPELRDMLVLRIDAGARHVVLDIDGVNFLDSSGLGVLVGALQYIRARGGNLDLVCTDAKLLKIFALTSLDDAFGIHGSTHAALMAHAFSHGAPEASQEAPAAIAS